MTMSPCRSGRPGVPMNYTRTVSGSTRASGGERSLSEGRCRQMVSYRAGRPSYTLDNFIGELPDLRDEHGKHYPWTPCREFPHAWDDDAEISQQRRSAMLCRTTCPALGACEQAMLLMGRAATGVWAGRVLSDDPLPQLAAFAVTVRHRRARRMTRQLPPLPPDIITVIDDQERV